MATGGRLNPGDSLTITLSGLPHRSRLLRNIGLGVGLLILAVGFWAAMGGSSRGKGPSDQLLRRREKLMGELVALEEQYRQGGVDERRYGSRRQSLMSQLERVLGELDHSTTLEPRRGGPGDGEGRAA
jgi:hypothetical protein